MTAGGEEFVGDVLRVAGGDGVRRGGEAVGFGDCDGAPGAGDAIPSVVAVHRVIAACDGGDGGVRRQRVLDCLDEGCAAVRGGVAAVGESVQGHRNAGRA